MKQEISFDMFTFIYQFTSDIYNSYKIIPNDVLIRIHGRSHQIYIYIYIYIYIFDSYVYRWSLWNCLWHLLLNLWTCKIFIPSNMQPWAKLHGILVFANATSLPSPRHGCFLKGIWESIKFEMQKWHWRNYWLFILVIERMFNRFPLTKFR